MPEEPLPSPSQSRLVFGRRRAVLGAALIAASSVAALVGFPLAPSPDPDFPQPRLPVARLEIGSSRVLAEVADSSRERAIGLMGRRHLPDGQGMVFIFCEPSPMEFWMSNTDIPLSIAYIAPSGLIREIHDLEPNSESLVKSVSSDIAYALEVPRGWFLRHGITAGMRVVGLPPMSSAEPE